MAAKRKISKKEMDSLRVAKIEQRERVVRKGRAKQERLRGFLRFVLTLILAAALYFAGTSKYWFLPQSAFSHPDGVSVQVINNKIVSSAKILAILKDDKIPKIPIYFMKTSGIKKRIKLLPPVDDVYVRRYAFPAWVQIIVREKVPAITIAPDLNAAPTAFMTQDGKLIGRGYLPLSADFKTIPVLSYGNKGDDYNKWNEAKVAQIQKIVRYAQTYSNEPVEYLDLRNPNDIFVKIKTVNIRLGKPDDEIYERMARIPSLLPQVKQLGSKVKYLDLSWKQVNYLKLK
jgi:cell division septal protein FtsQ